jgi:hypothetical protein
VLVRQGDFRAARKTTPRRNRERGGADNANARQVYVPRRKLRPIDRQVQDKLDNLSPAARLRLTQFARRGAQRLAAAGEPIADDEHEHIVHDAITDTLYGVVAWDQRIEIELHLHNVVRRRISNRIRRARKQVHVSLDASTGDDDAPEIASRDGAPEASLGRAEVTHQLYRTVCERVVGDTALLSILDAYKAEVSPRRAVMAVTGLGLPEFVNARRRLDRVLATLPAELRCAAVEAMRDSQVAQMSETTSERNV